MVMAAAIRMSMQQSIMMNAAVAMTTLYKRSMSIITMSTMIMMTMSVAAGTSIIMSMKSMSTMSVAVGTSIIMSIIMSTHIMFRGIPMTANVKFAILTRSTAMFVAKA